MMKPYKIDQQKWNSFSASLQLQHIATELSRATQAGLHGNEEWLRDAYERARILIDASLCDLKRQEQAPQLYRLRDAIAALYIGKTDPAIAHALSALLMRLSEK